MKNMHLRINEIWYLLHENADYFWGTRVTGYTDYLQDRKHVSGEWRWEGDFFLYAHLYLKHVNTLPITNTLPIINTFYT